MIGIERYAVCFLLALVLINLINLVIAFIKTKNMFTRSLLSILLSGGGLFLVGYLELGMPYKIAFIVLMIISAISFVLSYIRDAKNNM